MTPRTRRFLSSPLMPITSLAVSFVLTVVFFLVFRPESDGRVFFFPDNAGVEVGSERRGIPGRRDLEAKITVFLEELLIGPVDLHLSRTAPKGTSLKHAAVIGRTAYVDLGGGMLGSDSEFMVSIDEAMENIRRNILFNFPRIEDIVFTIEGSQVHAPYFDGDLSTN